MKTLKKTTQSPRTDKIQSAPIYNLYDQISGYMVLVWYWYEANGHVLITYRTVMTVLSKLIASGSEYRCLELSTSDSRAQRLPPDIRLCCGKEHTTWHHHVLDITWLGMVLYEAHQKDRRDLHHEMLRDLQRVSRTLQGFFLVLCRRNWDMHVVLALAVVINLQERTEVGLQAILLIPVSGKNVS